jgi:hypothetical protein
LRIFLLLLLSALAGCADPQTYIFERKTTKVTVVEVKRLPTLGRATWVNGMCYIALREYPTCLAHEVRHCLEGKWHGNEPNHDDCR